MALIEYEPAKVFVVSVLAQRSSMDSSKYTAPKGGSIGAVVGETYEIAPPKLDRERTRTTAGSIDEITFTLVGAPSSFYVQPDTGCVYLASQ